MLSARDPWSRERCVGAYILEAHVGRGATGDVYRARHRVTGSVAAVKVLRGTQATRPAFGRWLAREARAIARLRHPHILPLFEVGPEHLATGFVDGVDLGRRARALFDPAAKLKLLLQAGSALAHAHEAGVLHLDVKPANILVDRNDSAFLADFGLARIVGERADLPSGGTPPFMAPELLEGCVGPAADQYAFGRTIAAVLGEAPLPAAPAETASALPPGAPAALHALVERATHRDPTLRFPSVAALVEALSGVVWPSALRAPSRAPDRRASPAYRWLEAPRRYRAIAPQLARADHVLSELEASGHLPGGCLEALRSRTGLRDLALSVWGQESRLGALDRRFALARASGVIVLLHGWGDTREVWGAMAAALCRDNPEVIVVAPDLHGHGESPFAGAAPLRRHVGPRAITATLLYLLEVLGLRRLPLALVGHSMSAAALLRLTDLEIGPSASRVLLAPLFPMPFFDRLLHRGMAHALRAVGRLPWLFRLLVHGAMRLRPMLRELGAEHQAAIVRAFLTIPVEAHARLVEVLGEDEGLVATDELRQAVFLLGRQDPFATPRRLRHARRKLPIPDDQVRWMMHGRHHPHLERNAEPELTARNLHEIVHAIDEALAVAVDADRASTLLAGTEPLPAEVSPGIAAG